jgi:serine/threonine protein kinase
MPSLDGVGRSLRARAVSRSRFSPGRFADDDSAEVIADFEVLWIEGDPPPLEDFWARLGGGPTSLLSGLVKVELKGRFALGERPTVAEYLAKFPELRAADERVVSLAYEEYCLLKETGEPPEPGPFCERYEQWADSLASQIQYHELLSRAVGPTTRPRFPEPGEWFAGKFELRAPLGAGGAGRVFRAYQPKFCREVALKITPDIGSDREPEIVGLLDHERIVPVWSVDHEDARGLRGLCMPFRPGMTLQALIERVGPASSPRHARSLLDKVLPTAQVEAGHGLPNGWIGFPVEGSYADAAAWVALGIAQGLAHAHGRGVVHRDVKPANILLTIREGPQLLDFNLAEAPSGAEQAEAARSGGTLPYMAPEQLAAFLDPARWGGVGPSADLYALGLVLQELLTGDRPETPDPRLPLPRAVAAMLDLRALPVPSVRVRNPSIPHALAAIVAKCLAFEPSGRYPDASALADDLRRFLDRRPLAHARNPSRRERLANWTRRHRVAVGLGGTLGVTAALLLGLATSGELQDLMMKVVGVMDPAATLVNVANDHYKNGEFDLAEAGYRRALEHRPGLPAALYGLASVAYHPKADYPLAIELSERAIAAAQGSDLTAEKRFDIYRARCGAGLAWAEALLKRQETSKAVDELGAVLRASAEARRLVPEPSDSAPESADSASRRVIVKHFGVKATELLAMACLEGGDLHSCRAIRRDAYKELESCLALRPGDRNTLAALDLFLATTLWLQPEDSELLLRLVSHGARFPPPRR